MPLRITTEEPPRQTIRVDGNLTLTNLQTLAAVCDSAGTNVVIELGGLLTADEAAVNLLKQLRSKGAILHGARPYVSMLLETS